ncbi:hypothetical protein SK128_017957 [Halocaridina rubra]|uniref:Uncharacterized protein n=1 Tax=Halocaridina rubra TaxID=373956 RepID=A0AAN8X9H1_HALRR
MCKIFAKSNQTTYPKLNHNEDYIQASFKSATVECVQRVFLFLSIKIYCIMQSASPFSCNIPFRHIQYILSHDHYHKTWLAKLLFVSSCIMSFSLPSLYAMPFTSQCSIHNQAILYTKSKG